MKKTVFFVVLFTCLFTMFGCDGTPADEACKHVWGEWQFDDELHWRAYTCGHDSPKAEGAHTWDTGTEVEDGNGTHVMEYTCTVCGKKSQQVSTMIPPSPVTKDAIVDKVYVYEKDGCGGEFTIEIKADGTFTYYEGFLSSHVGVGEWSYSNEMLTLTEKTSRFNETYELEEALLSYRFSVEKDTLIFVDEGSDDFRYVKVKDGEKFSAQ